MRGINILIACQILFNAFYSVLKRKRFKKPKIYVSEFKSISARNTELQNDALRI